MKKRKVIIDCDPGIDDSLAIMLALQSEELEVVGITIVCGNCPVEMGFGNAKKSAEAYGQIRCSCLYRCRKTASPGSMSTHLTRMEKMDLVKAFYQK